MSNEQPTTHNTSMFKVQAPTDAELSTLNTHCLGKVDSVGKSKIEEDFGTHPGFIN